MPSFNTSQCKYITTNKQPVQYYLDIIKDAISSFVDNDSTLLEQEFNETKNDLIRQLHQKNLDLNSPKALHFIAYYAFTWVWADVCEDTSRQSGRPFALERLYIDPEDRTERSKPVGFSSNMVSAVQSSIYDTATQALLSKPNTFGDYNVIDFKQLKHDLNKAINDSYAQIKLKDPDLLKSYRPIKAVQTPVKQVVDKFDSELSRVVYNYNPRSL